MIEENKEKESKQETNEAQAEEEVKPEAQAEEDSKPQAEAKEEVKPEAEAEEDSKPKAQAEEEVKPEAQAEEEVKPEADQEIIIKTFDYDEFRPGDNITVNIKIIEGDRQRTQSFQGDVIKGRFNKTKEPDASSTFLIRRIASGVGVERIFPFHSPSIESIKLNRKGKVRQARIYYMRDRSGKRARIKERRD
jgi:large subunit ribosomal protein L19